jgi:nickel transport protein
MANGSRLIGVLLGLLVSLPLSAHKLKVFAAAEGEKIVGRAYFVGGAGARGAVIHILADDGGEVARLEPDREGHFDYRVERPMNYRVVADSLDGHQASWSLRAEEFSGAVPAEADAVAANEAPVPEPAPTTPAELSQTQTARLEQALARQIRPLREALQAHEERVRLRDILGGIGYIIGVAGLALWWSSRRQKGGR